MFGKIEVGVRASYSALLFDVEKGNWSAYSNIICSEFVRMMLAPLIDVVIDPSTCKIQGWLNEISSSLGVFMCFSITSSSGSVHFVTKSAKDYDLIDE